MTFVLYAGLYTPLKRVTSLCLAVGAVPGALPPVLGWLAAGGHWDLGSFALFAILFLWQFPHFFAIAWLHREDYFRAGLKMLPAGKSLPHVTGLLAVAYADLFDSRQPVTEPMRVGRFNLYCCRNHPGNSVFDCFDTVCLE